MATAGSPESKARSRKQGGGRPLAPDHKLDLTQDRSLRDSLDARAVIVGEAGKIDLQSQETRYPPGPLEEPGSSAAAGKGGGDSSRGAL